MVKLSFNDSLCLDIKRSISIIVLVCALQSFPSYTAGYLSLQTIYEQFQLLTYLKVAEYNLILREEYKVEKNTTHWGGGSSIPPYN